MGALGKGCGTCKKRKVKCDETRPRCKRCLNAGIACHGYTMRLRFVDEEPRIRRSMAISAAQLQEYSVIMKSCRSGLHSRRTSHSQIVGTIEPLRSLPLTAFKDDIFMSYLLFKLFTPMQRDESQFAGAQCGITPDWIHEMIKTSHSPRQKSWDALAAAVFGQAHKSSGILTDALGLYGQALAEFRDRLSSPDTRCADTTLASMTALYMHEMLVSNTEKGWLLHAEGLGWILQRRGPGQQKPSSAKSLFLEHRVLLISKSIISRQGTFLREHIWRTVPWEDDPASKSDLDRLVDIGTDIAEYISKSTKYRSETGTEFEIFQLHLEVTASLAELNTWWRNWVAAPSRHASEVPSHQIQSGPPFPSFLNYDSPWTAFGTCLYDAIRILLLQLRKTLQLVPSLDEAAILDEQNSTVLLGITSDTRGLAFEILRSLNYSYRMSRRFIFTCSFMFIQDIAYGCLDKDSEEALWAARHGWADEASPGDTEDANLLRRLPPVGQIKAI